MTDNQPTTQPWTAKKCIFWSKFTDINEELVCFQNNVLGFHIWFQNFRFIYTNLHPKQEYIQVYVQNFITYINSLWPSDNIWRHKSGSILAQVIACCLTAPSHYLNQCWLIISNVKWHSSKGKFTRDTSAINHWNHLENKVSFKFLRGQWVNILCLYDGIFGMDRKLHIVKYNYLSMPYLYWSSNQNISRPLFIKKTLSHGYKYLHYKPQMVWQPSQVYNGNPYIPIRCCFLNLLWPSDTIWRLISGSTLAQVRDCCLMSPSHYHNQCWLIISEVILAFTWRQFHGKCPRYLSLIWDWKWFILDDSYISQGPMS